jgi:DNA-binding MarR family transcriptional regulator
VTPGRTRRAGATVTVEPEDQQDQTTEAMLTVSRTMTAVVARTLSEVAEQITVPQLRVLVLLNSRGPMNLATLALHLGVNPSNASRTCEQLVDQGRVTSSPDPRDRRNAVLRLTQDGTRFVLDLMAARRRLIGQVVLRMDLDDQRTLAQGLAAFMAAVEAAPTEDAIGLPDGRIIPWLM